MQISAVSCQWLLIAMLLARGSSAAPIGHEYPMPVGCDPSYVNKMHPYYLLYTENGGDFDGADAHDDCPCVDQPDQCYSIDDSDFKANFHQCWNSVTWAMNFCVGNPNCDHRTNGAGGYYGHDGKELSKDSPRVLFQWYLANRPDRDCEPGSIDIQGCPQPCQVDLDAAVGSLPAPTPSPTPMPTPLSTPALSPAPTPALSQTPIGHEYPMPVGCDPSFVDKTHSYYFLYTENGGTFDGDASDECPCVEQPAQCYTIDNSDYTMVNSEFQANFGECWNAVTWAIDVCVGNPDCVHQSAGAGGYYGHDGKELSKDSPRVVFQWYMANRPDRGCHSGSIDVQGCPQPCQVDLDAAVGGSLRRLQDVLV